MPQVLDQVNGLMIIMKVSEMERKTDGKRLLPLVE